MFEDGRPDAANLLLPLIGFLPPDDPRARSNLERIRAELGDGDLVYRFREDAGDGDGGAFTVCSFWLVNALALDGRADEAAELLEAALGRASSTGLLAEEVDPGTGELLGNYPQAFAHAGVLTAAVNVARAGGIGSAPASEPAPAHTAHLVPLRSG